MDQNINGLFLGFSTLLLTAILEIMNKKSASNIIKEQGIHLYYSAWMNTTLNSIIYGPIVYSWVTNNLIYNSTNHHYIISAININSLLIIHSIGYWIAHIIMHNKKFFFMHRFHHKFSIHVSPVIAMAVSPYEYFFAYMLPFIIGSIMIIPNSNELNIAASIVSISNIIIHSPSFNIDVEYPDCLVSPSKHLSHHESMNTHLAAPTYDLDYIYGIFFNKSYNIVKQSNVNEKLNIISVPKSIKI